MDASENCIKMAKESVAGPALWDLFNHGRVRQNASLVSKILFLLYLPFGMLVLATRLVMFFLLCVIILVVPRKIGDVVTTPLLRFICGLVVRSNYNEKQLSSLASDGAEPYIIAGNHVSDFDTFALWMLLPKFYTITSAHLQSIPLIGSVYARMDCIFVAPTVESRSVVRSKIQEIVKKEPHPLVIFPEGGLTNGKAGTMMYHRFVFSLDCSIIPVAWSMNDPWPVTHDYLGSTWLKNFLWFMLVPYHVFNIDFLPVQRRDEEETPEAFAFRVQKITSDYLKIDATYHSYSQKKELAKSLTAAKKAKTM